MVDALDGMAPGSFATATQSDVVAHEIPSKAMFAEPALYCVDHPRQADNKTPARRTPAAGRSLLERRTLLAAA
jgi:hypothetical protein